jgi:iron complex transport system substrate-binding protein
LLHRSLAAVSAALAVLVVAGSGAAAPTATPKRIVSLSPTATESLFAIGAAKQVIAVDDQSDYPKNAPKTKLSGFTPNVEAIAEYKPDLVVIQYDPGSLVSSLERLKIKVVVQPAAQNLGEAYGQIRELGRLTGHDPQAKKVVRRMQQGIAKALRGVPRRAFTVFHEVTPDYYSATSKTFVGRIYTLFGLKNIADPADSTGTGYPQLSNEYIVAANPSLIVLADTRCCAQTRATVAARPGWSGMTAVRNRAILVADDSLASRWGPRIVDFARAIGSALRTIGKV